MQILTYHECFPLPHPHGRSLCLHFNVGLFGSGSLDILISKSAVIWLICSLIVTLLATTLIHPGIIGLAGTNDIFAVLKSIT